MNATLVKIGNSRGIRLSKPVIEQCGFERNVEIEVRHRELVIRPCNCPRDGWREAFSRMSECGDDELPEHAAQSNPTWDNEEWEW
ncbi:MAG: AbrB/MazE/SpoVT family DNA-binding domain-containing protein [Gammaproteobacteria bacterium]|nr:AbrB/MazE/SpoVT family DNA-binding domain-containing protein [Gammaproteobacteria bacterium]